MRNRLYSLIIISLFCVQISHASLAHKITLLPQEQELYERCSFEELFNAGRACKISGDIKEALMFMRAAVKKNPHDWQANWDLGDLYLITGNLQLGLAGFRYRWQHEPLYQKQLWNGESLEGKTICVYCQWGLGDTFMFLRFVPLLKQRGATVICVAQKPLVNLLSNCPYIDLVLSPNQPIPPFDYQTPITHLPEVFKTTIDTIPQPIPYIFVEQWLIDEWRMKLANDNRIKIGICWQGAKREDRQTDLRPMHLNMFEPLLRDNRFVVYSLQCGPGVEQIAEISSDCTLHTFDETFDRTNGAFVDTAAVMRNLDLVITIDTSVPHLAGALGVPVWVMLPYACEWRFFLHRSDSPWYNNMSLFRQAIPGDWHSVVEKVLKKLETYQKKDTQ